MVMVLLGNDKKNFVMTKRQYFCNLKKTASLVKKASNKGEFSSAGSEHLPYKQGVTGSNPVTPTNDGNYKRFPFFFNIQRNSAHI